MDDSFFIHFSERVKKLQDQETLDIFDSERALDNMKVKKPEVDSDEIKFHQNITSRIYTPKRNWRAYNQGQTREEAMFEDILIELIDRSVMPQIPIRQGRPFNDLKDMIFCCVMRAYRMKSCRRIVASLELAKKKGYIEKIPHYNTIFNYYNTPALTPILEHLIAQSAVPLAPIEMDFATDSTGYPTTLYGRWNDIRIRKENLRRLYKKAHITVGVLTHIVTAAVVTPGYYADSPIFNKQIKITAKTFKIREVSADKAYISRKNLQLVADLGGTPFIPFREKASTKPRGCNVWSVMKRIYDEHRDYFLLHYHKRSNVESTFSALKRKLGQYLRSKTDVGQTNELLCRILAYNITVLIHEYFEREIDINFNKCAKAGVAQ